MEVPRGEGYVTGAPRGWRAETEGGQGPQWRPGGAPTCRASVLREMGDPGGF